MRTLLSRYLFIFSSIALGAPPVDLTDPGALEKAPARKKITQPRLRDLTYTDDHSQYDIKMPQGAGKIRYDVVGRSLPNREGRPLVNFSEADAVQLVKLSLDKRWAMVQSIEIRPIKAWIPLSAVNFPTKKAATSGTPPPKPVPKPEDQADKELEEEMGFPE